MNPDTQDSRTDVEGMDPWGLRQVEQLLSGLEGVGSLKMVPDGHGGIDEVHVVSNSAVGAKQIVRNIESALLAEFGLQIDHRKISVAQIRKPDIPHTGSQEASGVAATASPQVEPARDVSRRLLLESLELERTAGDKVACHVTLRGAEESFEGTAEGPDFSQSRLEVAARAVLAALNEAALENVQLRLEGITRMEAFGRSLLVALVHGQEHRNKVTLTGVSLVTDSAEEASVLACLQATNRWASP
jgi:hypothetical protein